MNVLTVENLGKSFREYHSELHRFARWFGLPVQPSLEHRIIRNVSFSVAPGEAVGIVGENGAGKSTLLKLITGTLYPTEGRVRVNGRISAILELGMGFNPELSGRENAIHAAGLMGFTAAQIDDALQGIQEFAEIGDYFDEPVRTYSSGMQMRVAFAVATAWRPDILIIDEALSVGDSYFQHKCFNRIRDFQGEGTSLLFVSHSPDAVRMLCQRAILLSGGTISKIGDAASVMDHYHASQVLRMDLHPSEDATLSESEPKLEGRGAKVVLANKSTGAVTVEILNEKVPLQAGDEVTIRVKVKFDTPFQDPHIGIGIRNKMGITIYEANTFTLGVNTYPVIAGQTLTVTFSFLCHLFTGTYELVVGVANGGYSEGSFEQALFLDQSFLLFEVARSGRHNWGGLCDLQPKVQVD